MKIFFFSIFLIIFNYIIYIKFEAISKKLVFFDKPDGKLKKHLQPISLIGGLIILLNMYLIIFFFKIFNYENTIFIDDFLAFFILVTTLFYLIGLVDDLKNLSPNKKLFYIILSILLATYLFPDFKIEIVKISFLEKFYYLNYSSSTIFIILAFALIANAMNMFDGINLQLIIFTIFMFILFILKGFVSMFFILLLISLINLSLLNYQNKVFLGDSGSYLISAILGCTFIYQYKNFNNFFFGDEVFIVMLIPAIDMLRLFVIRIINNKNPFKGDLNHLHHLVNNLIKNKNLTVIVTIALCMVPSIFLFLNLTSYVIFILTLVIYFTLITYLRYKN